MVLNSPCSACRSRCTTSGHRVHVVTTLERDSFGHRNRLEAWFFSLHRVGPRPRRQLLVNYFCRVGHLQRKKRQCVREERRREKIPGERTCRGTHSLSLVFSTPAAVTYLVWSVVRALHHALIRGGDPDKRFLRQFHLALLLSCTRPSGTFPFSSTKWDEKRDDARSTSPFETRLFYLKICLHLQDA
jgi:hypothetical protein